ncbi:MAG: hypothetical protein H0X11_10010 [Betaproteobacteria bacterium]|nr:hypothetical protein [Betaproteobacteria bacterium]
MTPEQIRLACLSLALQTDACANCATEVAADFEDYVINGSDEDDTSALDSALRGPFGRPN